jgi:hypothetical protein
VVCCGVAKDFEGTVQGFVFILGLKDGLQSEKLGEDATCGPDIYSKEVIL